MCALKNPFVASSTRVLTVDAGSYLIKITQGKYEPLKGNFSDEIKELIGELLHKEPQHRPSVHKILEKEFIKRRISATLSKTLCRYENTLGEKHLANSSNSLLKSNPPLHNRSLSSSIKEPSLDDKTRIEKLTLQLN